MKNPFDFFDEIYCINLEHRTDRWELCQREFAKVGISDRVERFDAVYDKETPKRGCYESHMGAIRLAHERKLNNVLIFEDDVAFLDCYTEQKFSKSIETLRTKDWEFLYIGGLEKRIYPRRGYRPLRERGLAEYDEEFDYLMKCHSVGWAHSFAVNSSIFEKVVEDYDNNAWETLVQHFDSHSDRYYSEILQPKTYVCVPSFTSQYDVASDLTHNRKNKKLRVNLNQDKSMETSEKKNENIVFLGDSICRHYFPFLKDRLTEHGVNAEIPGKMVSQQWKQMRYIDRWLAPRRRQGPMFHADVVHFNFGLHSIKLPKDMPDFTRALPPWFDVYEEELIEEVERLKELGIKVLFSNTTPSPHDHHMRNDLDVVILNEIAERVMSKYEIPYNDLYGFVKSQPDEGRWLYRHARRENNCHFMDTGRKLLAENISKFVLGNLEK